ncbi:MAG: dihydropteroate synthase [Deltaproteobacteria bacterium]|nr:dihydropteroate synthase [Deltaproteobacteria bacterium]
MIQIIGILNCTPDSFSDGGDYSVAELVERGLKMAGEGADWIDVGGESTRPGAKPVSAEEELRRVIPVIHSIREKSRVLISIDTTKAQVAKESLNAGASMVNDVSALAADPAMAGVVRKSGAQVILMHSRGNPQTMQTLAVYDDVVSEVIRELKERIAFALEAGIAKEKILIDPGFGFAKNFDQNILLLKNLKKFSELGFPLVVGVSRKSFIGKLTGQDDPSKRVVGSLAAALWAVQGGASLLRVHDVPETRQMLQVFSSIG